MKSGLAPLPRPFVPTREDGESCAGFSYRNGTLYSDDVAVRTILQDKDVGTPAYIYSARRIREKYRILENAFRKVFPEKALPLIAYACKANSHTRILGLLGACGAGADIVSAGELARCLRAGIAPDKIVFSGVGKSPADLRKALEAGIRHINVESASELEDIIRIAQSLNVRAPVTFRFNPDIDDAGTHHKTTTGRAEDKFGLLRGDIERLYPYAAALPCLHVRGLHVHIGSQIMQTGSFTRSYAALSELAQQFRAQGLPVDTLDLGGGLGIPYHDETPPDMESYAAMIRDGFAAHREAALILEPGRFLVGDAGILAGQVLHIKNSGGRRFAIVDAGMNDLMRPALYGSWHEIVPVSLPARGSPEEQDTMVCDVVGPVCETSDIFAKDRPLPVSKGDFLAFLCAGAYGFSMASQYNSRPLPPEILVDGDSYRIIRKRQTIEEILDCES